ncbi:MAG TPA: hypothetical protein VHQ98_00780 [Gaiellaceae bacterium]|jgi:hypothetical protein|nr:hypothetical protein [Gaiellaceae bacterium]
MRRASETVSQARPPDTPPELHDVEVETFLAEDDAVLDESEAAKLTRRYGSTTSAQWRHA